MTGKVFISDLDTHVTKKEKNLYFFYKEMEWFIEDMSKIRYKVN